jgi:hypothetical protein
MSTTSPSDAKKNVTLGNDGDYQDPDFWPGSSPITSSHPFLTGMITEAVKTRACLLRDKFLEDLGILADECRYPRLALLKVTQLKLGDYTELKKGQREKNAFNGWSRAYAKEHPNPALGELGHRELLSIRTCLFFNSNKYIQKALKATT